MIQETELKDFTLYPIGYPVSEPDQIYFEHNRVGDDCAGHMWFENRTLIDYDGVFELPKQIITYMSHIGYDMSYCDDITLNNELPHST